MMVRGRMIRDLAPRAAEGGAAIVPFVARPVPQPKAKDTDWAAHQFEELERVIKELTAAAATVSAEVAALQAEVAALKLIVGDGSWDGGTP
jgi:prophage DNA circulation protein